MPYCSDCGSKVESGERFCPNCGQEQEAEVSVAPSRQVPARKSGRLLLILIPLVVIAVVAAGVFLLRPAPVITVPGDHPTIQAAIEAARDGDVIVVEPGTYRENIDFMGKAITLRSTAPDDPEVVAATIIDGGNNGSVVTFRTGETGEAVLSGFTITGGSGTWEVFEFEYEGRKEEIEGYFGGGILVIEGSSPTIEKNTIENNTADMGGGGIAVMLDSSPTITGNTITDNTADVDGGGILVMLDSSPAITGNTITGNTAGRGGGGILVIVDSSPAITGNTITGNTAGRSGGGIAVVFNCSPIIENNTITGNTADRGGGGGIVVKWDSSPAITGNTITGNTANISGGGIAVGHNSSPIIENNAITDNTARWGGGIAVEHNSSPTITGNTITGNTADEGGAIWVSGCSTLHLSIPDDNIYRDNVPDDIYYE